MNYTIYFSKFIQHESRSSLILILATGLAFILANTPLQNFYYYLLTTPIGFLTINLRTIINEGLMTIFFLLVSLEIKRELLIGELSTRERALLPTLAACGGIIVPALIYIAINHNHPKLLNGWAIPTATDIAFSLGILILFAPRIPKSLIVFLTALAIIDDLSAIIIIACFYTQQLHLIFLLFSFLCIFLLLLLNRLKINIFLFYAVLGTILWYCILKSGIHSTIAGVILAFTIPLETKKNYPQDSLLINLEKKLHPITSYIILPLFALANAGITFAHLTLKDLINPLPFGILLGLFLGKQIGIFGTCYLTIKSGITKLPTNANFLNLYGVCLLAGIGFTMSLFIGTLAFPANNTYMTLVRLGVLGGSLLSILAAFFVFNRLSTQPNKSPQKS